MEKVGLKRAVTLPFLVLYAVGNIVGAGIYILIGEIARISGYLTPLAFLAACIAVLFSALAYAELSSRYPSSAAEALYVQKAFGWKWVADISGFVIIASGLFSAAALISGLYGYIATFFDIGPYATAVAAIALLSLIALWGIEESVGLAALFTLIEVGGLVLIVLFGLFHGDLQKVSLANFIPHDLSALHKILLGSFLAFYAFIGFEDIVKISEEVVEPKKTLPRAIIIALLLTTFLYGSVAFVALMVANPIELAQSEAPLALVFEKVGGDARVLSLIALFAILNGALVQIIMVSRMLYGMAKEGWLPHFLAYVHPRTRTPLFATLLTGFLLAILVRFLDLVSLAEMTSYGIVLIFLLINVALLRIKMRYPAPEGAFVVPFWVPVVAIFVDLLFLGIKLFATL